MKSIARLDKRLAYLATGIPARVDPHIEAWMAVLSLEEISLAASIITRAINDRGDLTHDEADFLQDLCERPFDPVPATVRGLPRCHICGKQPATKDGAWSFCKRCHDAMSGGNVHIG